MKYAYYITPHSNKRDFSFVSILTTTTVKINIRWIQIRELTKYLKIVLIWTRVSNVKKIFDLILQELQKNLFFLQNFTECVPVRIYKKFCFFGGGCKELQNILGSDIAYL